MTDKTITSAGYIVRLYQVVETLTQNSALYLNLMLRLGARYDKEALASGQSSLTQDEVEAVDFLTGTIRSLTFETYVKAQALKDIIKSLKADDLKEIYGYIMKNKAFETEKVEELNVKVNALFVSGIMEDYLITAKELLERLGK
jgi:hypothetical protein